MARRSFWFVWAFLFAAPVQAQDVALTIDAYLEALDPSWTMEAKAEVEALKLDALAAQRGAGPSFGLEAEQVDATQWTVWAGRTFALSGRPDAESAVATRQAEVAARQLQRAMAEYRLAAARDFLETAALGRKIQHVTERVQNLEQARHDIARRVEAGDAAAFDLDWVERELRNTLRDRAADQATYERHTRELGSRTGHSSVAPAEAPPWPCDVAAGEDTPDRVVLQGAAKVHAAEAEAARRGWRPDLDVMAGYTGEDAAQVHHGFVVGLTLNFPLWTVSDAVDAAQARAQGASHALTWYDRLRTSRIASLGAECHALAATVVEAQAGVAKTRLLQERARRGYAAGEVALMEWMNAEQGLLEDLVRVEELELERQKVALQLRALAQGF